MTLVQSNVSSMRLHDMVDLALGTPEVGAVNFNVLHSLLHTLLKQLNLSDTVANVSNMDRVILSTAASPSRPTDDDGRESVLTAADSGVTDLHSLTPGGEKTTHFSSPYHALQNRVTHLEKQLDSFNSLPSNKEMLSDMLGNVTDKQQRIVSDMWQLLSVKKRLDANEEGIGRLSSLLDDLMREMAKINDENSQLKKQLKDVSDMSRLWEKINALEQSMKTVLDQCRAMSDRLDNYPDPESFSNLVTWESLEIALKGLKDEMELLKKPTERIVINMATDPVSRPQSGRNVISPGPSAALQEMLESLGALTTKHDQLDGRVTKLEEEMPTKANKSDLDNLKLPDDLLKNIQDLRSQLDTLMGLRNRDNEAMSRIREALNHLQKQVDKFNEAMQQLAEDSRNSLDRIEKLFNITSDHEDRKADIRFVEDCVQLKADILLLDAKVNFTLFDETTGNLHKLIQDLIKKLEFAEDEWKNLLAELGLTVDSKLDKGEMDALKEWLEKRLKMLASKIKTGGNFTTDGEDDAAGLRRQLLQHFHCISCDRPLEVMAQVPFPSIPEKGGLPSNKSMRPYTVFELDAIRQHAKNTSAELIDLYQTPRPCGGTHTVTQTHKRITRVPTNAFEEDNSAGPPKHFKDELDLQGVDGHIYKGRKERANTFYGQAASDLHSEKLPPMKSNQKVEGGTERVKSARITPRPASQPKPSNDEKQGGIGIKSSKGSKVTIHPPTPSIDVNLDEIMPSAIAMPTGREENSS